MPRVLLFALLLVTGFAQFALLPDIAPFGATPNLLMILLFFVCTRQDIGQSFAWIIAFGLLMDILAMDRLGMHALVLLPLALVAYFFYQRPWLINLGSIVSIVLVLAVLYNLTLGIMRGGIGISDIMVQSTMQALLVPIVYWFYRKLVARPV